MEHFVYTLFRFGGVAVIAEHCGKPDANDWLDRVQGIGMAYRCERRIELTNAEEAPRPIEPRLILCGIEVNRRQEIALGGRVVLLGE